MEHRWIGGVRGNVSDVLLKIQYIFNGNVSDVLLSLLPQALPHKEKRF